MKKRLLFLGLTLFYFHTVQSQQYLQLSNYSQVSIITVGPGTNLYETFGHSTIRIKDPVLNFDLAYNYGIFDFNAPNFYTNFAKGRLLYKLARYPFHTFVRSNKVDKRWVKEQVLNLSQEQRQQFFEFLENNAKQENASYLYDPYFNNCSTKLRDISRLLLKDSITLDTTYASDKTLRQLMNDKLYWNTWGNTGINIALGNKLDDVATADQYMYLPYFVYLAFKKGTIKVNGESQPIVKKELDILIFEEPTVSTSIFSPFYFFLFIFCLGAYITYRDYIKKRRTKWLDFFLFFTTGLIGIAIVFLWFFTDHFTTPNNFNLLWAFGLNIVIAFYTFKNNLVTRFKKYILFLLILLGVTILLWFLGIQLFAISLIPFLALLGLRYTYLLTSKE